MTSTQRAHLTALARRLRRVAEPVGPMHAWWDTIGDIEAVLNDRRPIYEQSVEAWISHAEMLLRGER